MTELRTESIRTLNEYTILVETLREAAGGGPLWFRGCGMAEHDLTPSLYRHPTCTEPADLLLLETRLLARFKQRCIPYMIRTPVDDWDYLFLMQHVGVPTRLLDWTENPFIGLYFAITGAEQQRATGSADFVAPAAVWVLNPTTWNRQALSHMSFAGDILSVGDGQLEGYAPAAELAFMTNEPVALYGMHNSARIVAQRGVFSIFGSTMAPMDQIYEAAPFPEDALVKIELPADALSGLRDSIFAIGYTESVIFPDLDGLADELRRFFGFVV